MSRHLRPMFKKGERIYVPDDLSDRIFFINEGRIKISVMNDEGKEITKAILGRGEVFGEWKSGSAVERGSVWSDVEYPIDAMDRGKAVIVSVMLPGGAASIGIDDLRFVVNVPPCPCPGDADGNLRVEFADITAVLANWGASYPGPGGAGDADCGGTVTFQDVTMVLSRMGQVCP